MKLAYACLICKRNGIFTYAMVVFYIITQNICTQNMEPLPRERSLLGVEQWQEKGRKIAGAYSSHQCSGSLFKILLSTHVLKSWGSKINFLKVRPYETTSPVPASLLLLVTISNAMNKA